jgi:precorrin-6B methylase 1
MIHIDITAPYDMPDDVADALTFVALTEALCTVAERLGLDRETLIQRMPGVIAACWAKEEPKEPVEEPCPST